MLDERPSENIYPQAWLRYQTLALQPGTADGVGGKYHYHRRRKYLETEG